MGKSWRRFSEGVRQKLLPDPAFPSTSNERNFRMLYEAEAFARNLKNVNNQLKRIALDIAGLGVNMKTLLGAPLPRPYVVTETGNVVPVTADAEIVGYGVQIERITTTSNALQLRMHEDVHQTIEQWLAEFESVKILLKQVEELRLELDSRKRTVLKLKDSANKTKKRLDNGTGKQIHAIDTAEKTLRHKEEKCANCKAEFDQQEENCSAAFSTLLTDLGGLQHYLAQAYRLINEMSSEAFRSFNQGHYEVPNPYAQQAHPQFQTPETSPSPAPQG